LPEAPAAADQVAPPSSSAAWTGWREFRVIRREFEDASYTQCSFYLAPVDGVSLPPFRPGQFLTVGLEVANARSEGGVGVHTVTRCYSLSDTPESTSYRVTIKRVIAPIDRPDLPAGASSSHFHDRVQEGDVLRLKAPSGHFCIDPDASVPAVLIAGGIGITPMMSMLRWCLAEQPGRRVNLYFGLRNGDEHPFKHQLEQLASLHPHFHLTMVYSRPGPTDVIGRDYNAVGHIDIELLRRTLPHGRHRFYVCGPAAMMASLVPAIIDWGVPEQDLHYEAFGPASVHIARILPETPPPILATAVEVHFQRSGRTLAWEGRDESLLEFAERHGIVVDSGCRSGSCGTCETKLISGTVHYTHEPDHDVVPGHCLLCVCTPRSTLVLEA